MMFHPGERKIQERLGLSEGAASLAERAIYTYMPPRHRSMLNQLPFLIAASRDPQQRLWATALPGFPGFLTFPSERILNIASLALPSDALEQGFAVGSEIGLLGIDLAARRRNRVNGVVREKSDGATVVEVKQCFGNCPQHITTREWRRSVSAQDTKQVIFSQSLTKRAMEWVRNADTFFIASAYQAPGQNVGGLDVSHRGGARGFVEILNDSQLRFYNYAGNNFFNTLGNLELNPEVAILFVDFREGSLLQISGRAQLDWQAAEIRQDKLALCQVTVDIEEVVISYHTFPIRWKNI